MGDYSHAQPAGSSVVPSPPGAYGGAGTSTDRASGHRGIDSRRGGLSGRPALSRAGTYRPVTLKQVVQRQAHHDGHRATTGGESGSFVSQVGHHPVSRRQTKRRTTGQNQSIDAFHGALGGQQVELSGGRGPSPYLTGGPRALRA